MFSEMFEYSSHKLVRVLVFEPRELVLGNCTSTRRTRTINTRTRSRTLSTWNKSNYECSCSAFSIFRVMSAGKSYTLFLLC